MNYLTAVTVTNPDSFYHKATGHVVAKEVRKVPQTQDIVKYLVQFSDSTGYREWFKGDELSAVEKKGFF